MKQWRNDEEHFLGKAIFWASRDLGVLFFLQRRTVDCRPWIFFKIHSAPQCSTPTWIKGWLLVTHESLPNFANQLLYFYLLNLAYLVVVLWRLASYADSFWVCLMESLAIVVSRLRQRHRTMFNLLIVDINFHGCPPDSQTPAVLSRKDNPCEDRFSRLLRGDTSLHERLLIQGWLCEWTWHVFCQHIQMKWVCMLYGKHPPVNCKTIIWLSLIYHRWVFPWRPPFSSGISQRISSMTGPTRRDSRRYDACAATRTLEVATKNDSQLFGSVRVGSNGMCGGFGQRQLGWKRAQIHKSS